MDSEESPLDVLSRAATMVSPPSYEESRSYSNKEISCGKWRREKRQPINNKVLDVPLDFSTRQQPNLKPPPTYDQSIQRKMARPSVIQSAYAVSPMTRKKAALRDSDVTSKFRPEDVCDPAIDEHFRRSLGKEYSSIFFKDCQELSKSENSESDSTGLTVDDHFAKALGETWTKLKEKENQEKISTSIKSNNNNLGIVKDMSVGQNDRSMKKRKKSSKDGGLNEKRVTVTPGWVKT